LQLVGVMVEEKRRWIVLSSLVDYQRRELVVCEDREKSSVSGHRSLAVPHSSPNDICCYGHPYNMVRCPVPHILLRVLLEPNWGGVSAGECVRR
jgi:hypothetical protein